MLEGRIYIRNEDDLDRAIGILDHNFIDNDLDGDDRIIYDIDDETEICELFDENDIGYDII